MAFSPVESIVRFVGRRFFLLFLAMSLIHWKFEGDDYSVAQNK